MQVFYAANMPTTNNSFQRQGNLNKYCSSNPYRLQRVKQNKIYIKYECEVKIAACKFVKW